MIINTQLSHDAEYIGDIQENRVGIDRNNIDFIATLLTSSLYSKPLDSFLRETVSNAYDSHVEAGTEDPILLLIEETNRYKDYRISIRDYGTGLSPERFDEIYKNIGSSTKRESNDYIGMFGIGRFSCLSCASTANITSYYNGIKYSYIMYKNGGGINIDKLGEVAGDFKNGLEVSIMKTIYSTNDWRQALNSLRLFDRLHVVFKGEDYSISRIVEEFNTRVVHRFKTFAHCNLCLYREYFKVGNVVYEAADKWPIETSVIIDLPMGTVDITPNREALQYTSTTQNTISSQAALVKKELCELVNEELNRKDHTIASLYNGFADGRCIVVHPDPNDNVYTLSIDRRDCSIDTNNVTINGEKIPEGYIEYLRFLSSFCIDKSLIHKTVNKTSCRRAREPLLSEFLSGRTDLVSKEDKVTKQVTLDYLRSCSKPVAVILVYEGMEELKKYLRKLATDHWYNPNVKINLDECLDFTIKHLPITHLSNDAVPSSFIDSHKRTNLKEKKDSGEIPVRVYTTEGYRLGGLWEFLKAKGEGLIIYSAHMKEDDTLKQLSEITRFDSIKAVISLKPEYFKYIQGNKQFVEITSFMYMKQPFLVKLATSFKIREEYEALQCSYLLLPKIIKEFRRKYLKYAGMNNNATLRDIVAYYEKMGWLNNCDIKYFTLNDKEKQALKWWGEVDKKSSEFIQMAVYQRFGRMPKIGLVPCKIPKIV